MASALVEKNPRLRQDPGHWTNREWNNADWMARQEAEWMERRPRVIRTVQRSWQDWDGDQEEEHHDDVEYTGEEGENDT